MININKTDSGQPSEKLTFRQKLLKYELSKINADNVPNIAEAESINQKVRKMVTEMAEAWENSRDMPFSRHSDYRILAEFSDTILAARDDTDTDRGLFFVTWKYDFDRQDVNTGHYTDNYDEARDSFVTRSGLVEQSRLFPNEVNWGEIDGETPDTEIKSEPAKPQQSGKASILKQVAQNLKDIKPPDSTKNKSKNRDIDD